MRKCVICIFLFAAGLLLAEPVVPVGCELPIDFREGLLWLKVDVTQSAKPLNFLVDCGASDSMLNEATARQLGLKPGRKVRVNGVGGTLVGSSPVQLAATAGPMKLPDQYITLDLSKLSGACSNSVDGLLGADFFRNRIVQIDYKAQKLRVLQSSPRHEVAQAIPLESRRCGFGIPVSVNGRKARRMRLDTGCVAALHWVTTDVAHNQYSVKPAVGLAELSIPQTVVSVGVGSQLVTNVPAGLHARTIFPGEAGLLGNGFLSRFGVITIDAKAGWLILGSPLAE